MNVFLRSMKAALEAVKAEYELDSDGKIILVVFACIEHAQDFLEVCHSHELWLDPIPIGIPAHRNRHVVFFEER